MNLSGKYIEMHFDKVIDEVQKSIYINHINRFRGENRLMFRKRFLLEAAQVDHNL